MLETVRRTLPAIGYTWTRRGVRRGRRTVDRVTARSRAKEAAVAGIAAAEARNLGDRARVLVLCDHERATATTRRRLADGPGEESAAPATTAPAAQPTPRRRCTRSRSTSASPIIATPVGAMMPTDGAA